MSGYDYKPKRSKKGRLANFAAGGLYRTWNGFFVNKRKKKNKTILDDPEKRILQKKGREWQKKGFYSFHEYFLHIKNQQKKELEHLVSKGKHPVTITEEDNL